MKACYTVRMTDPTEHPKYAEVMAMKAAAEANDLTGYCFDTDEGRHKVFYVEADRALVPGHIYSRAGYREYGISGYCEKCFDRICQEPDEDELPDEIIDEMPEYIASKQHVDSFEDF